MERLISFDLKADFGFLRKPDTNDGLSMSYNMLHKPALLGILGAIAGYDGYSQKGVLPEYYQKLNETKIGIAPINAQNGAFAKTTIVYTNTVGYANKDGNLICYENTLIKPCYRIYLILDDGDILYQNIVKYEAEYLPYIGKNEFPAWWENVQMHNIQLFDFNQDYEVESIFIKQETVSSEIDTVPYDFFNPGRDFFLYFERLPIGFRSFSTKRGTEFQYQMAQFSYTNLVFKKSRIANLFHLSSGKTIQLF